MKSYATPPASLAEGFKPLYLLKLVGKTLILSDVFGGASEPSLRCCRQVRPPASRDPSDGRIQASQLQVEFVRGRRDQLRETAQELLLKPYSGLRFSGLPIASRKMTLLPFACGEKK